MRNLQSEKFIKRRRIKSASLIAGSIAAAALFVYILSSLANLSSLSLSEVRVFGADEDIASAIHDTVVSHIEGRYLGIFSRSNAFLYPKSSISQELKSRFPKVLDVKISRASLRSLNVSVSQKIPKAVICPQLPDFQDDMLDQSKLDGCYLADASGYIFDRSPGFSRNPYDLYFAPDLVLVGSSTGFIGSCATGTELFVALQSFYDAAQSVGLPVDGLLMKPGGEYEIYASSTIVYFDEASDFSKQKDNLAAFWSHAIADSRSKRVRPAFEYIDLRYGSNVFYK